MDIYENETCEYCNINTTRRCLSCGSSAPRKTREQLAEARESIKYFRSFKTGWYKQADRIAELEALLLSLSDDNDVLKGDILLYKEQLLNK